MAVALVVLGSLCGCRPTDTLTDIVYADWATEVDYDNPTKTLVNAPNKEPTTSLPKVYETDKIDDSEEDETETTEPSDDAPEDAPKADQAVFDADAPADTAKSAAKPKKTKDAKKKKRSSAQTEKTASEAEEPEGEGASEAEAEEAEPPQEDDPAGQTQAQVGGNVVGNDPTSDLTSEPDRVGSVIAFGEMANMVALLGGSEALWAADDTFLAAASQIYSEPFDKTHSGLWDDYSDSSSTITGDQYKQLISYLDAEEGSSRPAYLIYDAKVGCPVTDAQAERLKEKYGIDILYFFLNTYPTMKNAMNYVKKILKDFGAPSRYDEYWQFHDATLSSINGGKAAAWSTGAGVARMNFADGTSFSAGNVLGDAEACWTLLIDNWDYDATYSADGITASYGLGYSTLGYAWSPVSYYMQRGGVINNAAARYQSAGNSFNAKETYYRYAWQMGTYFNTIKDKGSHCILNASKDFGKSDGDVLLRAQSGEFGLGKLAGQGRFPAVVVLDDAAKQAMESDRKSGGVYAAHYLPAGSTENNKSDPVMGVTHVNDNGSTSLWLSYIGRESGSIDARTSADCVADPAYEGESNCYDVLVNPHGVYSNWVSGSVESFLEAPWAYWAIANAQPDGAAGVVGDFYEQFYGKRPSADVVSAILSGSYAS